jgi:hypothetical protein
MAQYIAKQFSTSTNANVGKRDKKAVQYRNTIQFWHVTKQH